MSDLIDRQALLKQIDIDSDGEPGYYGDTWKFIDTIKSMPPAQPKKIRGQWSIKGQAIDTVRGYWAKCSACGHSVFGGGNYCSNCGSYNKGEVNNESN